MKTITIITPSNTEVEYRLAGAGSRLAAFMIDFFAQMLLVLLGSVILLWWLDRVVFGNVGNPGGVALGVWMVFSFLVQFGYFVACEMRTNGQSVGKRIFGLRVIRENGEPLDFWQSFLRGLLRQTLDMLFVGLFVILFSKKHKRLGDMAAGTIVIIEKSENVAIFSESPPWPDFLPDPFVLTPEERQLTEEWLSRRESLPDRGAAIGEKLLMYFKKYEAEQEMHFKKY